ncbi:hypothetical protein Pint_34188 [Pistacia integerrima]|uniref:Uncharacterized protein n=1 Tax=Pistacia integerrima TaxID=434235 RepID=A0ACC0X827_9ROSI|nr:hypothetical protein Pint_34188 [Pistacia integerrima]
MLPRFDTHYIAMFTLLHLKLPAAFLGSFVVQSFNLFYQSHFEDWSLMANPEAHETDHRRRKVFELKKELQRLLKTILDEDDYGMQKCSGPISGDFVADPVVLANGQTFDCPWIQKWLNEGNRTCPQIHIVVPHTVLIPTRLVHEIVSQWRQEHGVELPKAIQDIDEDFVTDVDRSYFNSLLEKMSSSLSDQKEAAGFV